MTVFEGFLIFAAFTVAMASVFFGFNTSTGFRWVLVVAEVAVAAVLVVAFIRSRRNTPPQWR